MSTIKKIKLDNTTYDISVDWENIESKPGEIPTKTSDLINDSGFLTAHQDISGKENLSNKTTEINSSYTNVENRNYPTNGAVRKFVGEMIGLEDEYNLETFAQKATTLSGYGITDAYTKPTTGIPKTDLAENVQTSLTKADNATTIETGTITNNYGWYDAGTQLTGTYNLFGDLCIITGYAQVKTGRGEIWYSLPVAAVQGAAAIAMDGGNYYCIGTSVKDNISVMRITKMDEENFLENKTIHFVLTYKCQ